MKKRILFAAMMAAVSVPAVAGTGVDVHVSTLGYGADLAFQMTDTVAVRVGLNQFKKNIDKTSGDLKYTGDLKLSSFGLLADWHLFNGVTHLTAGLMGNGNKLNLSAATSPTGTYTINGVSYSGADIGTLTTTVEFNKTAPYLGFGWSGQPKNSGFSFNSDFGIMFQGSPKATITSTNNTAATASAISNAQTQLNEDLKNYKYYPVISIGIGYAF